MTVMDRVWTDNGSTFWPPEGWHGLDPIDWPRTFEVWIKYDDEAERRRIHDRKHLLVCQHARYVGAQRQECRAEGVGVRWARTHGLAEHPGERVSFNYVHARWTYEMLGFPELYDGRPIGWYEALDGADERDRTYEADALALGDRVACLLRREVSSSGEIR